jgi:hypothetical protein
MAGVNRQPNGRRVNHIDHGDCFDEPSGQVRSGEQPSSPATDSAGSRSPEGDQGKNGKGEATFSGSLQQTTSRGGLFGGVSPATIAAILAGGREVALSDLVLRGGSPAEPQQRPAAAISQVSGWVPRLGLGL